MKDNKLLIVGIDPGTTTAYSILDLQGNVVSIKSSKNLGLNGLLADILKNGKVVGIGTDKAKIPSLVEKFSAKTGARIIYPSEDLKVDEKKSLIKEFKTDNEHQHDALASSLFALKRVKGILDRIDAYAKENKRENIKDSIIDLVLTKETSIREAVDIIENSHEEETRIIKGVIEEKILKQSDFMRLYRIIKRYEKDIYLLRKQNNNLKKQIRGLEKKYSYLDPKIIAIKAGRRFQKNILFKEKSINFLGSEINNKNNEITNLYKNISKLNGMISRINEILVLKRLDSLGSDEFNKKRQLLNIAKDDVLLVEDPNIISANVANFLEGKVNIIITKIPASRKIKQRCNFTFINSEAIGAIDETELFAFVLKKEINDVLKSESVLKSIIEGYKKSREYLSKSL